MTDKELYELCQLYGKEVRLARNKFVALLPEVYCRGLYRRKGFGSIFEFAAKLGGVSRNVVEEVIRVDRKLEEMPKLKEKIAEVGISKVRVVANAATKESDEEWAEKVSTMTKSALETHVQDIRKSHPGMGKPIEPQQLYFGNDYQDFTAKLHFQTIQKLKHLKANMKDGTTWNEVFEFLLDNKILKKQRARNLKIKAKQICEAPNCTKPATIIHHVDRYSITGNHENLKSLCKDHHELEHQTDNSVDVKFRSYRI